MSRKIRVGIVGCGKIAAVDHVPGYRKVEGVEIVSLVDSNGATAERLLASAGLEAAIFTDFDAFLANSLDAVSICTPNHLHAPMALAALDRGLHVLCEKPIAGTLDDADAMVAAAAAAGRVLQINQSLRYHPLYATAAALVRGGAIGRPVHARCIRAGASAPNRGWSPGADWFVSRAAHGGLLLDIGVHMADALRWIVGDVEQVRGDLQSRAPGGEVPDNVQALMRHAGGCTSVLELSWTFPTGASRLEVYGEAGTLVAAGGEHPLTLTRVEGGKPVASHPELVPAPPSSYESFARAIRGEAPSPTPGELGRDALAICLAIASSAETGQVTSVPQPAYDQELAHA